MATSQADREKCRILTPEFRVSYPHIFKAQAMPGTNNPPKYSITMLFPKDTDLTSLKAAMTNAKVARFGADSSKWPKVKSAVSDGDGEAGRSKKTNDPLEGYAGHWVVKASTNEDQKPGLVDESVKAIIEPAKFYAGCYARAYIFAYVWEFPKGSGKFGMGFILDHVQKLRDGKSFAGKKPAEQVFDPVAGGGLIEEDFSDDAADDEDFT